MNEKYPATQFRYSIETLSPFHIGNGQISQRGFDFLTRGGQTFFIDPSKLAGEWFDTGEDRFDKLLEGVPPGDLIEAEAINPEADYYRYILKGEPDKDKHTHRTSNEIRAHIKTGQKIYIPGSSIKGTLRSYLFRMGIIRSKKQINPQSLPPKSKEAAKYLEKSIFGFSAHEDWLRAFRISDSDFKPITDNLVVNTAYIAKTDHLKQPIAVECIPPQLTFNGDLSIDSYPFRYPQAVRELQFGQYLSWVSNLIKIIRPQVTKRFEEEMAFFDPGTPIHRWYDQRSRELENLPDNSTYLQIGWGTGWIDKTAGILISAKARKEIALKYHLTRHKVPKGLPFPRTRRVIRDVNNSGRQPAVPFGWVKFTIREKQGRL